MKESKDEKWALIGVTKRVELATKNEEKRERKEMVKTYLNEGGGEGGGGGREVEPKADGESWLFLVDFDSEILKRQILVT